MKRWITAFAGTALWLALAAVAFTWPPVWSPGDKPFEIMGAGVFPIGNEMLSVEVRIYQDGTEVVLVNGRPSSVDQHPGEACASYWSDEGMARLGAKPGSPGREIPSALWREPDWQLVHSQSPLCKWA